MCFTIKNVKKKNLIYLTISYSICLISMPQFENLTFLQVSFRKISWLTRTSPKSASKFSTTCSRWIALTAVYTSSLSLLVHDRNGLNFNWIRHRRLSGTTYYSSLQPSTSQHTLAVLVMHTCDMLLFILFLCCFFLQVF